MTPQELKNSILQLAIQGKLVEQRPEEGTAEELYRQIQEEKKRLIKEGKIKKEKPLPEIAEDEVPFEIPESWKWVSITDCGSFISGYTPKPEYLTTTGTIPYFKVADMNQDGNDLYLSVTNSYLKSDYSAKFYLANTIVYPKNGGAVFTNKKRILLHDSVVDLNIGGYYPIAPSNVMFTYTFFSTIDFRQYSKGTALPTIDMDKLKRKWMPLPPLAEQKRIVAKIEELLPYMDRYEQAWNRLEDFNKRFPVDMQKSLLQWAIQGKLVEQRPEEGTAEELYRQIQEEKRRLVKEGKIKKEKPLPEIAEDNMPFEIPGSWKWVRLGNIISFQGGYAYKSSAYVTVSGNQVIRLGNVKDNKLLLDEKQVFISDALAKETEDYRIHAGDILVTMTGTRRKKDYFYTLLVAEKDLVGKSLFLNQRVGCFRVVSQVHLSYLLFVLQNDAIRDIIFTKETGTANQGNLGSENIKKFVYVPLPPFAEQNRIVAKLEELLAMCERLK